MKILATFNKSRSDKCYMAIKLDMDKVYDRLDSDFIKNVLLILVFSDTWINLMKLCITTPSIKVNIMVNRTVIPSGVRH